MRSWVFYKPIASVRIFSSRKSSLQVFLDCRLHMSLTNDKREETPKSLENGFEISKFKTLIRWWFSINLCNYYEPFTKLDFATQY